MESKLLNEHHDSVLTEKNTVNSINIDSKEELCEPFLNKLGKATSDNSYTSLNSVKSKERYLIEDCAESKEDKLTMSAKITSKVVLDKNHLITPPIPSKNENMTSSNDYPKPKEVLNGLVNSIGNNVEDINSVTSQLQDENINDCSSSSLEESSSIITKEMLLEEEKCKSEEKKTMDEVRMKVGSNFFKR